MTKEAIVGLIFMAAMAALGYFTVIVTDTNAFGLMGGGDAPNAHNYTVTFRDVGGLEVGHKVRLAGAPIGEVAATHHTADGQVKVVLSTWKPVPFFDDYAVRVKDVSPLGGKYVDIQAGSAGQPVSDPAQLTTLVGTVQRGLLDEGGEAISRLEQRLIETVEEIKATFTNLHEITDEIKSGKGTLGRIYKDEALYERLLSVVGDLKEFAASLNNKQGTVGKLLNDSELHDQLKAGVDDLRAIIADVREGKGSAGKLFKDSELHDELLALVKDLRGGVNGDGSLGKFIRDPQLYDNANQAVADIKGLVADARAGKGTLGKLLTDDTLYSSLNAAIADVQAITGDLREGKGTLGKLLTDESVYNELKAALRELGQSIEDTREQAPVNTFTGVLFSAF